MRSSPDHPEPVQPASTTPATMDVWARRLLFLRIVLITVLLFGILVWLLSFVINPILILIVAALLAYFTVKTLVPQLNALANSVTTYVTLGNNGQDSPLVQMLKSVGITQSQINTATKQLQTQLSTIAADVAKGAEQLIGGIISIGFNILITTVVSIYLLIDGYRFGGWVIRSSPASQQGWISTVLAMIAGSQVFGIWGAVFAAPTAGLIQALVGAFWHYYRKTHAQEFPLQQVEHTANPQEETALRVNTESAVTEPSS